MSIVKYKTSKWSIVIERLEITRETERYVFYRRYPNSKADCKELKDTNIHDSWEAARRHLINRAREAVEYKERHLQYAKGEVDRAVQLPEVEPAPVAANPIPASGELVL